MRGSACRTSALAVTMLFAWCISAAAQDYAGREKLRAQSNEFRKEVIRVTGWRVRGRWLRRRLEEVDEQPAQDGRLFLLHPMAGAVHQVCTLVLVVTVFSRRSNAPGF